MTTVPVTSPAKYIYCHLCNLQNSRLATQPSEKEAESRIPPAEIQVHGLQVHDSIEDAWAAMQLYIFDRPRLSWHVSCQQYMECASFVNIGMTIQSRNYAKQFITCAIFHQCLQPGNPGHTGGSRCCRCESSLCATGICIGLSWVYVHVGLTIHPSCIENDVVKKHQRITTNAERQLEEVSMDTWV